MASFSRHGFLATATAAVRAVPRIASRPRARVILKLAYVKSMGQMRVVH